MKRFNSSDSSAAFISISSSKGKQNSTLIKSNYLFYSRMPTCSGFCFQWFSLSGLPNDALVLYSFGVLCSFCVRLVSLTFTISDLADSEERAQKTNQGYSRDFQAMLDSLEEEDYSETASHVSEKKRRLNLHQVKALEKSFEVENKLEPERKLKLAGELGLQPRQVAIWFQNRRARWKTKQLERDYSTLKASYEALKLDYSNLEQKNGVLAQKVKELKAKLSEEKADSSHSVKEEYRVSESDNNASVHSKIHDFSGNNNNSSAITKDPSNISSSHELMNWFQFSDSRVVLGNRYQVYQPHLLKPEDQSLFSTEESCNFFSVDQAPTLHCYFPEQ